MGSTAKTWTNWLDTRPQVRPPESTATHHLDRRYRSSKPVRRVTLVGRVRFPSASASSSFGICTRTDLIKRCVGWPPTIERTQRPERVNLVLAPDTKEHCKSDKRQDDDGQHADFYCLRGTAPTGVSDCWLPVESSAALPALPSWPGGAGEARPTTGSRRRAPRLWTPVMTGSRRRARRLWGRMTVRRRRTLSSGRGCS